MVWFSKLTVILYLESGVGGWGSLGGGFVCGLLTLKEKRAVRILSSVFNHLIC